MRRPLCLAAISFALGLAAGVLLTLTTSGDEVAPPTEVAALPLAPAPAHDTPVCAHGPTVTPPASSVAVAEAPSAAHAAPNAPAEAASPAPAQPAEAHPPASLAAWLALAADAPELPAGFEEWLRADPERLRAMADRLQALPPELAARVAEVLGKAAPKDREVQAAMLELAGDPSAEPAVRAAALDVLAAAVRADPLFAERLPASERSLLAQLAAAGPPDTRAAALRVLSGMAEDPLAAPVFVQAWNDPGLPLESRKEALRGLKHADAHTAWPVLVEAIRSADEVQIRQQAAVSLVYLDPDSHADATFTALVPGLGDERDWIAKGFSLVALMQLDHTRAETVLRDLELGEADPWEAEKYAALAAIAANESDYQRILHQGIQAYRRIEARKAEALAQ